MPRGCDEFSYLLAADTFARGRLTNSPHPLWQHFETFHVIQQPTYASKYPPAQGLVLALGKVLAGTPNLGLWLSADLAAAATCWMLQGWMPARWALLGGLLVALHPKIQLAWSQTYWGGNLALLGATPLLGAYPRVVRRRRWTDAVMMGLGLAMLANSRPFPTRRAPVSVTRYGIMPKPAGHCQPNPALRAGPRWRLTPDEMVRRSTGNPGHFDDLAGCHWYAWGYVSAVADTLQNLMDSRSPASIRIPVVATLGQQKDVVLAYLDAHPEQLHLNASRLIYDAFSSAWPAPPASVPK